MTKADHTYIKAVGIDVTAMGPEELAEAGVRIRGHREPVVTKADRIVMSHAAYCQKDKVAEQIERSYTRQRARLYVEKHKSLKGFTIPHIYPCPGQLRHLEWNGNVQMVACDECGFDVGIIYPQPGSDE